MILILLEKEELSPIGQFIYFSVIIFLVALIVIFILYKLFNFFEMAYVEYFNKKLFYNHKYIKKKKLPKDQKSILRQYINFYNRLSSKHKSYFEHRVKQFIKTTEFIGKDITVTDEMKVVTAATLVKLTFGLRDYNISLVERVIFYPEAFYSTTNKTYHKGEFNLGYKALVFSWKDVKHGYEIEDDNLNLAIHEFIHAIHFYYMSVRKRSTSAAIFLNSYYELTEDLDKDSKLKKELITSDYVREYAFTNQYEFLAVFVETFIETPHEFRTQFPTIYTKIKTMLNFNFSGY
ncbi:zinc-dependent peptidase [uncultured Psychroserpens sp.]|uniref:zinc-dependent peptidase n=1 Tax=uncultured Psychroserpens sp. TaxID=255436 RepID=UPI00261F846E|nr:zinc-dependent peptidase [uncultured Psychroserpens sp.]